MKHITPKITLKGSLLVRLERYNEKHHPGRRVQRSIYELMERALRNEQGGHRFGWRLQTQSNKSLTLSERAGPCFLTVERK